MVLKAPEHSYREFLMKDYFLRKSKNARYSLRAFAKLLKLSPGFLSLLFNGKKNLGQRNASRIADSLKWTLDQKKYFLNLVEYENPRTEHSKKIALEQINISQRDLFVYDLYDADTFAKFSEWHHNAILMLLTLKNNKNTALNISKKLNLTLSDTKAALQRLQRLGFVSQKKSVWVSATTYFKVRSVPSEAIRKYHKQMLTIAEKALDQQSFETRDFSNITFTVVPEKIALAKAKIAQFRQELAQLLDGQEASEVYQLSVQLFKVTQSPKELYVK